MKPRLILLILAIGPLCLFSQDYAYKTISWEEERFQRQLEFIPNQDSAHYLFHHEDFQFFTTQTGSSGEILERHYAIQLSSKKALKKFYILYHERNYGGVLRTFDFRVWKNGEVIYDPNEEQLRGRQVRGAGLQGMKNTPTVFLKVGDALEEGCILEVYYRFEGVHLPNYFTIDQKYSVGEAHIEINYRSTKRELVVDHSPLVNTTISKEFGTTSYLFEAKGLRRSPLIKGLTPRNGIGSYVQIDWRDVQDYGDGKIYSSWYEYVPDLFYKGDIYDFGDYENFDNQSFGSRTHLSSTVNLVSHYSNARVLDLVFNFRSFATLSSAPIVMDDLNDLNRAIDSLATDTSLPIVEGVQSVNNLVNNFVIKIISYSRGNDFIHYSLLSKFYYDYLNARGYNLLPILMKVKRNGPFKPDYISANQFSASAIGFYDEKGKFHFTMLGPYLGSFYAVDYFPSDFSGGQAVAFDLESKQSHSIGLPYNPVSWDGFKKSTIMELSFETNEKKVFEEYNLNGAFRNRIYYEYIMQPDSAIDVMRFNPRIRGKNAIYNRPGFSNPISKKAWVQKYPINLNLYEALCLKQSVSPSSNSKDPVYLTALPMPYQVEFLYIIKADKPFDFEVEKMDPFSSKVVDVQYTEERVSDTEIKLVVVFSFKEHLIGMRDVKDYRKAWEFMLKSLKLTVKERV